MLYPCTTSLKKKKREKEREASSSWTQIMLQARDESTVHAASTQAWLGRGVGDTRTILLLRGNDLQ